MWMGIMGAHLTMEPIFTALELKTFQKNKKIIGNKNIVTNIYSIQVCNLIMCEYFCIGFIDFMLKGKPLLDYTDLFFPNKYEKNGKKVLKYFH